MNRFLFVIFFVIHCITCRKNQCLPSTYGNQAVLTQLGQNITLECRIIEACHDYYWRISNSEGYDDIRKGACGLKYNACFEGNQVNDLQVYPNRYDLYYQCGCLGVSHASAYGACLILIPQFNLNVRIDGESQTFDSSCDRNTENEILNVMEGQSITAFCPEMSNLENSCSTSDPFGPFLVSISSHGCFIACKYNDCSVNVSLHVELGEATVLSTTYDRPERKRTTTITPTFSSSVTRKLNRMKEKGTTKPIISNYPPSFSRGPKQTDPESPASGLTFGVIVLVIVVIILLLVAFGLCTYLYFAKGWRKPKSGVTNNSKVVPKSTVENIPTYDNVNKDTNGHENDDLSALKERPSNNSAVIDAEYSLVNLESTVTHTGKPQSSPGNVTSKNLEEVEDGQYSVVNDESKENAKIESVRSTADYDSVEVSSSQSKPHTPNLDIPEYAEVKKPACKQETDISVLYASVEKKS